MRFTPIVVLALMCTACTSSEYNEGLAKCQTLTFVAKDTCLQDLAKEFKTLEPCQNIRQSGVRVPCMVEAAVAACDEGMCDDIGEAWQRPNCKARVQSALQCASN